jgi:hypothetical protein
MPKGVIDAIGESSGSHQRLFLTIVQGSFEILGERLDLIESRDEPAYDTPPLKRFRPRRKNNWNSTRPGR